MWCIHRDLDSFVKLVFVSGHVKARDVICHWRRKAPFERLNRELPRGVWGHAPQGNFSKRTLKNVVSSVSGHQASVSQERLEFTQTLFKK